jgi:hypothetical protein
MVVVCVLHLAIRSGLTKVFFHGIRTPSLHSYIGNKTLVVKLLQILYNSYSSMNYWAVATLHSIVEMVCTIYTAPTSPGAIIYRFPSKTRQRLD